MTTGIGALLSGRPSELPAPAVRRAIRHQAGLTEQQLASVLGVSRVAVARWELGTREPRGALRRKYAEALSALMRAGTSAP